ncbi:MAG: LLM class flavin-dependent oxidoreductase [Pseudorhodoplanes sp.]
MRFGYFASYVRGDIDKPLPQVYRDTAEQVECAEAAGFDIIWFPEHHFTHHFCAPHPLINIVDMARLTKRVRLGTSVLIAPFRHPLILAEEIGMVDHLVEGRLELGFARGASNYQYRRFGLDDSEAAGRLSECLDILLGIWRTDDDFEYHGTYYDFGPTYVVPRPLQKPHPPLAIAARTPETLRFCIERGLGLHTTPMRQPKSAAATTMNIIKAIASEYPEMAGFPITIQTETVVSNDWDVVMNAMRFLERNHTRLVNSTRRQPIKAYGSLDPLEEGARITAQQLSERAVVGNPESCVRQILEYEALGMNEYIAAMDFGQPQHETLKSIELFGREVIPRYREESKKLARPDARSARADSAAKKSELVEARNRSLGAGWQEWRESEWLDYFNRNGQANGARCEIFDFSAGPSNVRADAAGVVGSSGKLMLIRDRGCPDCGRPVLCLCYRPNGESMQCLHDMLQKQDAWSSWHARHP